jgi:hypothetical protein
MTFFPFDGILEVLTLPEDAVREKRWVQALEGAFNFVGTLTDAWREKDRLGENLRRFCEFVHYTAEVHNGGHGQYLDNCRPTLATLRNLTSDIEQLESPDYAAIGTDFLQAIETLPEGKDHTDGSFTGCELLKPLDKRYFALWYSDPLEGRMVQFLEKQSWVKLAPPEAMNASTQAIRNLRELKRNVTMPSPEGVARFVEFTHRIFSARGTRK